MSGGESSAAAKRPSLRARLGRMLVKRLIRPRLDAAAPVERQRRSLEFLSRSARLPPGSRTAETTANGVPLTRVTREEGTRGAVLYFHGGGYCLGSPAGHRELAAHIGRAAGLEVLLPDYRLAPEHPYPAALEDAVAAYDWALGQDAAAEDLFVAGDSAGGGLAVALALELRARDRAPPAGIVAISPWVDLTLSGETTGDPGARDPMLSRAWLAQAADWYAGGASPATPLISPAFADLAGLPPLLIQVGGDELLLDDARRLAAAAERDGVAVTYEEWPAMWHDFQLFAGWMPEARRAVASIARFVETVSN